MGDELKSIKKHIKSQLKKGYSLDIIRTSLIQAGFSKDKVNNAMADLRLLKDSKPKKPFFSRFLMPEKKKEAEKQEKSVLQKAAVGSKPEESLPAVQEKQAPEKKEINKMPLPEKASDAKDFGPAKTAESSVFSVKSRTRLVLFTAIALLLVFFVLFGLASALPVNCRNQDCFISKANQCLAATYTNQIEGTTFRYEASNCVLRKTIIAMSSGEPQAIVDAFMGKDMRCRYIKNDFSPLFINSITAYLEACEGPLKDQITLAQL